MIGRVIEFSLRFKPVIFALLGLGIVLGWRVSPFGPASIAVDAIPDLGENQQIVFSKWTGRSPQDIEDQVTYPLTSALLGIAKVKSVRSYSYFGFSSIYVVFEEGAEWDWSRNKVREKLDSLAHGSLPEGVIPTLGPDATALGQIFWYTLEGRDREGKPASGWTPQELRSIQDYQVRYALQSVSGVAEVSSVGGYLREYQIDVDPDAMRAYGVSLDLVFKAVQEANLDVGAHTIEINKVEYVIRSKGFLKSLDDLRETVVGVREDVPVTLSEIATVQLGPAVRRGALDKDGAEAVGGVVVARFGANPMEVIESVKARMELLQKSLPRKGDSQVTLIPFYDRSVLIEETLDTLNTALFDEILITVIVVLLLVFHFRSSVLVSLMLPLVVLFTFGAMKIFGVTANVVALSGIAIAIGTVVDVGIVLTESILSRLEREKESLFQSVLEGAKSVSPAIFTAVLTTVISFLPVFLLTGEDGKLYQPLAFTKTFALLGALVVGIVVLPPISALILDSRKARVEPKLTIGFLRSQSVTFLVAGAAAILLALHWKPLGSGAIGNVLFVFAAIGLLLFACHAVMKSYEGILRVLIRQKWIVAVASVVVVSLGGLIFNSLEREFRPRLDEGSFLFMPTTMPHASIGEAMDILHTQDRAIGAIPEVASAVGKIGRVDSALDPAPVSMIETVINYLPEYDENGVRQWRDHIHSADDIWDEILAAAELPGVTSAPKLQPIETRLVMLQTGLRAPLGIKVTGPDLKVIEKVALDFEAHLKKVPELDPRTVSADRVVGKPYLEIEVDRTAAARYGVSIKRIQDVIEVGIGGRQLTTTIEGRERYPVRVRYQRERRDSIEEMKRVLVPTPKGLQIPLGELATISYVRGPQVIKSEDTFQLAYVICDAASGVSKVTAAKAIEGAISSFPATVGVEISSVGAYQSFVASQERLFLIALVALVLIFVVIYLQLRSILTTFVIWAGVLVAFSGGLILIWLYGQPWFLDAWNLREVFQIKPILWSTAVGVGFLALFGIATDDGVLMGTYIRERLGTMKPKTRDDIREAVVLAAVKRNRPAMMTTATTLLALLPVLTSRGRGSEVMLPMAIPTFGGMLMAVLTVYLVPTVLCWIEEIRLKQSTSQTQILK